MHEELELERVEREKIIIVLDDINYLVRCEIGKEVNDELLVVFQNYDSELLKDMP
jgi:hypothetical protein